MAWVTERLEYGILTAFLGENEVQLDSMNAEEAFVLHPVSQDEAHSWALIFRKTARRLEEIGKGLK
jgi:hypothetical protein